MKILRYESARLFLAMLERDFPGSQIENSLMLGLVQLLVQDPDHFNGKPFMATVVDSGKAVVAAFMTPSWNILVFSTGNEIAEPYRMLIDYLLREQIHVPGVNARSERSELFARLWCERTNATGHLLTRTRLFELKEIGEIRRAHGHLVRADQRQMDLLVDWSIRFHEAANITVDQAFLERHVKFIITSGNAFLWRDGPPVSMTFRLRPYSVGISIGYVYTPPEYRNRGYATSCVEAVCRTTLAEGIEHCILFADLANPTSNSIYQQIGFEPVCEYSTYFFKEGNK